MVFVQISTPPQSMHQKLTKHGRCCMQINRLLFKSHVGLKDTSIVLKNRSEKMCLHCLLSFSFDGFYAMEVLMFQVCLSLYCCSCASLTTQILLELIIKLPSWVQSFLRPLLLSFQRSALCKTNFFFVGHSYFVCISLTATISEQSRRAETIKLSQPC